MSERVARFVDSSDFFTRSLANLRDFFLSASDKADICPEVASGATSFPAVERRSLGGFISFEK